jgi:hypothetical protein
VLRRIQLLLAKLARHFPRLLRNRRWQQFIAAILGHAKSDEEQGFCWPGTNRLARLMKSLASVARACRIALVKLDLIRRVRRLCNDGKTREGYIVRGWDSTYDDSPTPSSRSGGARRTRNSGGASTAAPFPPIDPRDLSGQSETAPTANPTAQKAEEDRKARREFERGRTFADARASEDAIKIEMAYSLASLDADPPMVRKMMEQLRISVAFMRMQYNRALSKRNPCGFYVRMLWLAGTGKMKDGTTGGKAFVAPVDDTADKTLSEAQSLVADARRECAEAYGPVRGPVAEIRRRAMRLTPVQREAVKRWIDEQYDEHHHVRVLIRQGRVNAEVWEARERAMDELGF